MRDPFAFEGSYHDLLKIKLTEVLANAPPQRSFLVIRKVLENLILAERIAASRGAEINDRDRYITMQQDYDGIQAEVDRAMGEFIGSILSAEGG
jgi:hypothetical protein